MSLPTGILTFCFTDVEGSSELWERQPDAMARALVWHDHLVAKTVEVHGGHLIKSMGEGDSTVSVFAHAGDAVAAAVSLQRALLGDGDNELGLAVRVGLNTGPAEQRDKTYFGSTVNLAARLEGQSTGDDVIISAPVYSDPEVRELLRDEASGFTSSRFEIPLKGFDEECFELWRVARASTEPYAVASG